MRRGVVDVFPTNEALHMGDGGRLLIDHDYLRAIEAAGTDEAKRVMAKMRETPINDFFAKNGRIREDGRMVHDMYVYEVKKPSESKGECTITSSRCHPGDELSFPQGQYLSLVKGLTALAALLSVRAEPSWMSRCRCAAPRCFPTPQGQACCHFAAAKLRDSGPHYAMIRE